MGAQNRPKPNTLDTKLGLDRFLFVRDETRPSDIRGGDGAARGLQPIRSVRRRGSAAGSSGRDARREPKGPALTRRADLVLTFVDLETIPADRKVIALDKRASAAPANPHRPWFLFRSFTGWRLRDLGADVVAGVTLAAIAIPSQMATARLANLTPQVGLLALIAAAIGFALFGDSRRLSVGADSTIAPIFAGALAALASTGPEHYAAAAATLSLAVGLILICAGAFKFGFVADLLSIPVTTGFLIGIAGHILFLQAPVVLGVELGHGSLAEEALSLIASAPAANPWTLAIGLGVPAIMVAGEAVSPRFPGALIGLCLAGLATVALGLEARGVATLGSLAGAAPHLSLPVVSWGDIRVVAPLAVLIAVVVMVQTAATTRSFPNSADGPDVNRDFIGVGAANAFAGVIGAFPVDASPPSTAVAAEAGCRSQFAGLAFSRGGALRSPVRRQSARSSAVRGAGGRPPLCRGAPGAGRRDARRVETKPGRVSADPRDCACDPGAPDRGGRGPSASSFQCCTACGRRRAPETIEFERIPGTSVWWPRDKDTKGEFVPAVRVIALQAPLSFLNAYNFRRAVERFAVKIRRRS